MSKKDTQQSTTLHIQPLKQDLWIMLSKLDIVNILKAIHVGKDNARGMLQPTEGRDRENYAFEE